LYRRDSASSVSVKTGHTCKCECDPEVQTASHLSLLWMMTAYKIIHQDLSTNVQHFSCVSGGSAWDKHWLCSSYLLPALQPLLFTQPMPYFLGASECQEYE